MRGVPLVSVDAARATAGSASAEGRAAAVARRAGARERSDMVKARGWMVGGGEKHRPTTTSKASARAAGASTISRGRRRGAA
jgi:hypothetical protein